MDALRQLTGNVPEWQRKLDQLSEEIDNRQIELAAQYNQPKPRSLRLQGSMVTLKPKDEPAAFPDEGPIAVDVADVQQDRQPKSLQHDETTDQQAQAAETDPAPSLGQLQTPIDEPAAFPPIAADGVLDDQQADKAGPALSSGRLQTASAIALQRQTHQVLAVSQAKARAVVKRKQRTESMMSRAEDAPQGRRTRYMIIVYYDSHVQTFFEELVKFVSASRNRMRKVKMAARVAMIKRMAELEFPEEDNDDGSGGANSNAGTEEVSIWDKLDKVLESVQSMCEHASHIFLREGDCSEDTDNIRQKLGEARDLADKELERASKEGLGVLQDEKPSSQKNIRMRKPKTDDALASSNDLDPVASLIVDTAPGNTDPNTTGPIDTAPEAAVVSLQPLVLVPEQPALELKVVKEEQRLCGVGNPASGVGPKLRDTTSSSSRTKSIDTQFALHLQQLTPGTMSHVYSFVVVARTGTRRMQICFGRVRDEAARILERRPRRIWQRGQEAAHLARGEIDGGCRRRRMTLGGCI